MKTGKILTEEISDLTVGSLPTRPTSPVALGGRGYSPREMKHAFDRLPLFIVERFNSRIDDIKAVGEDSVAAAIPSGVSEGHSLSDLLGDITNGAFASYLTVLDKTLSVHITEILERLNRLEGGSI